MKRLGLGWLGLLGTWVAGAWSQGIMLPVQYAPVQGAPFSLMLRTDFDASQGGPRQSFMRISRDGEGRQRYEAPVVEGVARSTEVNVYDVVAGKRIRLDTAAKTAEVFPIRVSKAVRLDVSARNLPLPETASEGQTLLGTKTLGGLEAWGEKNVKTTRRGDGMTMTTEREEWFSVAYKMPLLEVLQIDGRGPLTQRVLEFESREPDAALFRIPEGYKVSDAPPDSIPAPGTVRIGGKVTPPKVLYAPEPEFSEEARRKRIDGNVLVYLVVNEQGRSENVKVAKGLGNGLDEKAVEAVKGYRFSPAMRDGVPVKVEMHVSVNFQIFTRP